MTNVNLKFNLHFAIVPRGNEAILVVVDTLFTAPGTWNVSATTAFTMEDEFSGRDYSEHEYSPIEDIRCFQIDHNRTQQPHGGTDKLSTQRLTAQNSYLYHSGASSTSVYSQSSSGSPTKDAFRLLTREILNNPLLKPAKNTGKPVLTLEPDKFNPMRSMEVPIMYDNAGDSSQSAGGREMLWPFHHETPKAAPGVPQKAFSYPVDAIQYNRRLPISKSEGNNVKSLDGTPNYDDAPYGGDHYYHNWNPPAKVFPGQQKQRSGSPDRRCGRGRSLSPVKILEDLDENLPLEFLESPTKRPRSPHKKLFGENGWLGRSPSSKESPSEKTKKPGFKSLGEKIKQRVEDMTADVKKSKERFQSTFPISLDPPTQAKLYSEVELMICVTANKFLLDQHKEGRISVESVTKVTNFWASKNRPQVVQFQFDQLTQRDLVIYNLRTFKFHGECAQNVVALNATLRNWKAVAKEMSIRTFCTPDSVIRKHMHDTHKILEMLGAPLVTFLAFQELQVNTLSLMKREQEKQMQEMGRHGVAKEYHPPSLAQHENEDRGRSRGSRCK
ncbi:hypothetical protein AJ78_07219 [Emergomyces pasteurianus Ep9510]|uniref:Uncharacterized protein n=1 Tax=Emergomyces pasteurianus Ep9510 TaxID=1447872 RepID=A0A1J9Q868_9EURO|nr:hypothetical protein AJ78_07219 [Emergomyces pasteurianus Ep9510]